MELTILCGTPRIQAVVQTLLTARTVTLFSTYPAERMGVHSGRATSTDGAGRTGTEYATNGCTRTTDAATNRILDVHATDPITSLTVTNN